jgi:hypothetical protein
MAKVITYECKECGCEIVVSGSHESHLRPIYCCGVEVANVSAASKKACAPTAKNKKAGTETAKKLTANKPSAKAAEKKKGPERKTTSKR